MVSQVGLPVSVKVGAVVYKVVWGERDEILERSKSWGEVDHGGQRIHLNSTAPVGQRRDTLWHEILHCVARHANLDAAWGAEAEDYVERLETALLMVFADNPAVVAMLAPVPPPVVPGEMTSTSDKYFMCPIFRLRPVVPGQVVGPDYKDRCLGEEGHVGPHWFDQEGATSLPLEESWAEKHVPCGFPVGNAMWSGVCGLSLGHGGEHWATGVAR